MLTKVDLVERFYDLGYTKKAARVIIDDIVKVLITALLEGETIKLNGFGIFYIKEIKPRETIHVKTQQRVTIPGFKCPKFVAGKTLKRAIKEGFLREPD